MKRFACRCGQEVFFENFHCLKCGALLGFDPEALQMLALSGDAQGRYRAAGAEHGKTTYRPCRNRLEHEICNWVIADHDAGHYCLSCRLNEVIPNLAVFRNVQLWGRLEQAKRRLIYSLQCLRLPLRHPSGTSMAFRFLEDQRSNPSVSESFVLTGHLGGTITINVAEADDSVRHAVREDMQERYRTLLGHFRHESGHFYFDDLVTAEPAAIAEFRALFGDERADYEGALQAHHARRETGIGWSEHFVSAYASAHPLEDWAETWAHYLHIRDTLETAAELGVVEQPDFGHDSRCWLPVWMSLSVILNELNRSMGTDDLYPFVLSSQVSEKLLFIHRRVARAAGVTAVGANR